MVKCGPKEDDVLTTLGVVKFMVFCYSFHFFSLCGFLSFGRYDTDALG